jgi:hypothetical protein
MTLEEMEAEIKSLREQQEDQRKLWVRWGFGSYAIGMTLCIVNGIKTLTTGNDPVMNFLALTFLFLGLSFTTGRR